MLALYRAPNANAVAERWIRSTRVSLSLNPMIMAH